MGPQGKRQKKEEKRRRKKCNNAYGGERGRPRRRRLTSLPAYGEIGENKKALSLSHDVYILYIFFLFFRSLFGERDEWEENLISR